MQTPIAVYIGSQERIKGAPIALFNLITALPNHCVDSTVSAQTLRINGVTVPRKLVAGQVLMTKSTMRANKACAVV